MPSRPRVIEEVSSQDEVVRILRKTVESKNVPSG